MQAPREGRIKLKLLSSNAVAVLAFAAARGGAGRRAARHVQGRRMNAAGINQGTSGNVSLRNPHGFLITPTSPPYDAMEPADVVQVGFDGADRPERRALP